MTKNNCIKHPLLLHLLIKSARIWPDKMFLQLLFRIKLGKKLNLKRPKTFNEKLQWLKLYERKPEYTIMVDKIEAKKWAADRIGSGHVIPTLGVWDKFEDIDFDSLPNQFVLKTNHDSGGVVICKDKSHFDTERAKKILKKSLKRNYFLSHREWPYKNVQRKIFAEKYMVDESGYELKDYKYFCFDGEVKFLFIATDRYNDKVETKFDFFDDEFNHMPLTNGHPNSKKVIHKPDGFEKMKEFARILSKGISHVRVDFYNINGEIYFGEMTFYHYSGTTPFEPEEWDLKFGELIKLPIDK